MEGFTVSMALVDAIPVLLFAASATILGSRFDSPLFITAVILMTLNSIRKVLWKLILGIKKKDISAFNKYFLPIQMTCMLLMIVSVVLGHKNIVWAGVLTQITSMPNMIFYILFFIMMIVMIWHKKVKFKNTAKDNWTAQFINMAAQLFLLLGLIV